MNARKILAARRPRASSQRHGNSAPRGAPGLANSAQRAGRNARRIHRLPQSDRRGRTLIPRTWATNHTTKDSQ